MAEVKEINAESAEMGMVLNPFALPYVDLDDKTDLPKKPGLYFVVDEKVLLYIGRTKDLNQRWKSHHRYKQVRAIAKNPQIAFLDIEDESLLSVERDLIVRFNPMLNDTKVDQAWEQHWEQHSHEGFSQAPKSSKKEPYSKDRNSSGSWEKVEMPTPDQIILFVEEAPLADLVATVDAAKSVYSERLVSETKRIIVDACLVSSGNEELVNTIVESILGASAGYRESRRRNKTPCGTQDTP